MGVKYFYLSMAFIGTVLPYYYLLAFVKEKGLDFGDIMIEIFSTQLGSFFGWGGIVSILVVTAFIFMEARRLRIPGYWLSIFGTLTVGVSLGLPLFLYLRTAHLQQLEIIEKAKQLKR